MSEILSTFRLMPENKEEVWKFSKGLIQSISSGHAKPEEIDNRLNSLEEMIFVVRNIKEIIPATISTENKRRETIQQNVVEQPDLLMLNSQESEKPFPI